MQDHLKDDLIEDISLKLKVAIDGNKKIVLITAHRRENFGTPLLQICKALSILAKKYPDVIFVYPVHLNPHVRETVYSQLSGIENILLLQPQTYCQFFFLMSKASLILTDSGGVQEEAVVLQKPLIILRDTTERPEGVNSKVAQLVGTNKDKIVEHACRFLNNEFDYSDENANRWLYGTGNASQLIKNVLLNYK